MDAELAGPAEPRSANASDCRPTTAGSWRWWSTASGRASAPGTSCSRARLRREPGAPRHVPRRERAPALHRRDGLRRALPAADPPDRADRSQGHEQHRRGRRPTTPAARGPSARARAGTRRSTPSSARSTISGSWSTQRREHGLELALDIAFQCSPDHPYVSEHPEWFRARPDGTIQYAENPPKKYQDIYPVRLRDAPTGASCGRS